MPVTNLAFRAISGSFYWTFSFFMQKRVKQIVAARDKTLRVCWSLNIVRTVLLIGCVCVTLCAIAADTETYNREHGRGNSNSFCPIQHSMTALSSSLLMLATVTRRPTSTRSSCFVHLQVSVTVHYTGNVGLLHTAAVVLSACVYVFIAGFLLTCGDVESNPGPGPGSSDRGIVADNTTGTHAPYDQYSTDNNNSSYRFYGDPSPLGRFQAELSHTLNQAITRMETTSRQQGQNIEQRLRRVEDKIDHRLRAVEDNQGQLHSDMRELHSQCQSLWEQNEDLRSSVNHLTSKCDSLENQNKRNNLLFFGLSTARGVFESWEECELKVRQAIREGMGITEEINIERAYRSGRVIIARFLSYKQRMLVLSNAHRLNGSDTFSNIFVREDFSEIVQQKRKGLLPTQRELKQKGYKADLRFDKLVTREATYTFDLESSTVRTNNTWYSHTYSDVVRRREARIFEPEQHATRVGHQPSRDAAGLLLNTSEFPSLRSSSKQRGSRGDDSTRVSPLEGDANGNTPAHQRQGSSVTTPTTSPQRQGSSATAPTTSPQRRTGDAASRDGGLRQGPEADHSAPSQQESSGYNLRTRKAASTANPATEMNRVDSTERRTETRSDQPATPSASYTPGRQSVRGFGRGRKTPPSQTRIDSMFRASQTDPPPPARENPAVPEASTAEGGGDHDVEAVFEDAVDTDT